MDIFPCKKEKIRSNAMKMVWADIGLNARFRTSKQHKSLLKSSLPRGTWHSSKDRREWRRLQHSPLRSFPLPTLFYSHFCWSSLSLGTEFLFIFCTFHECKYINVFFKPTTSISNLLLCLTSHIPIYVSRV